MSLTKRLIPPLTSGILFGAGLTLGGMTNPERVSGFLDVFGRWDPTLAFAMAGAVPQLLPHAPTPHASAADFAGPVVR